MRGRLDSDWGPIAQGALHDAFLFEERRPVVDRVSRPVDGVVSDHEPGFGVICCRVDQSSFLHHHLLLLVHPFQYAEVFGPDHLHQPFDGARRLEQKRNSCSSPLKLSRLVEVVVGEVASQADQLALVDDVVDGAPPLVVVVALHPEGVLFVRLVLEDVGPESVCLHSGLHRRRTGAKVVQDSPVAVWLAHYRHVPQLFSGLAVLRAARTRHQAVLGVEVLHVLRLDGELVFAHFGEHESLEAQDLQVGSVVPQQVAGELLALAEHSSTDHAEVLLVVLVPAVNLPRQLAGVEALAAMPAHLGFLHPLRTEGTLVGLLIIEEVLPQVLHVLVGVVGILTVSLERSVEVC